MSFIKKKDDKGSSIWDWIFLGGLVIGGLSLWRYLTTQKGKTNTGFDRADSLYKAGDFKGAREIYEELRDADYLSPAHDSILYERVEILDSIFDEQKAADEVDSAAVPDGSASKSDPVSG